MDELALEVLLSAKARPSSLTAVAYEASTFVPLANRSTHITLHCPIACPAPMLAASPADHYS